MKKTYEDKYKKAIISIFLNKSGTELEEELSKLVEENINLTKENEYFKHELHNQQEKNEGFRRENAELRLKYDEQIKMTEEYQKIIKNVDMESLERIKSQSKQSSILSTPREEAKISYISLTNPVKKDVFYEYFSDTKSSTSKIRNSSVSTQETPMKNPYKPRAISQKSSKTILEISKSLRQKFLHESLSKPKNKPEFVPSCMRSKRNPKYVKIDYLTLSNSFCVGLSAKPKIN